MKALEVYWHYSDQAFITVRILMEDSGKFPGFSEEQEVLCNPLYGV